MKADELRIELEKNRFPTVVQVASVQQDKMGLPAGARKYEYTED